MLSGETTGTTHNEKQRDEIIQLIREANGSGATQSKVCDIIGISAKTLQRWNKPDNVQDGRLDGQHKPPNKMTELERQRIIKVANEPEFAKLPPGKIVP